MRLSISIMQMCMIYISSTLNDQIMLTSTMPITVARVVTVVVSEVLFQSL